MGIKYIVEDEVLVRFLSDEVREDDLLFKKGEISFKEALKREIFKSKNKKKGEKENEEEKEEVEKIIAAANAITILVAADVNFIGETLSGIKIRGANLRDGNFVGCDFSDADLTEVIMENCKLEASLFNGTILKDIKLGIYPDIMVGSEVLSCCFSPDGMEILSGSLDNTIKLWDKGSGKMLKSFEGHSNSVMSVAFSPDGQSILSGSSDKTIKLWDKGSGKMLKSFEGHKDSVRSVAFSPDGQSIISGSWDNTIKLWDKGSGKKLKSFEGHSDYVMSVAFSPDGQSILSFWIT